MPCVLAFVVHHSCRASKKKAPFSGRLFDYLKLYFLLLQFLVTDPHAVE